MMLWNTTKAQYMSLIIKRSIRPGGMFLMMLFGRRNIYSLYSRKV